METVATCEKKEILGIAVQVFVADTDMFGMRAQRDNTRGTCGS